MKTKELSKGKVEYKDIFESVDRQKEAVQLILQLINIREELVGEKANPSNSSEMLMDSDNFQHMGVCSTWSETLSKTIQHKHNMFLFICESTIN